MFAEFRRNAGYALRLLARAPGFAAVSIATLALGIGASTAIFSIVDGVLLRPLRFANPEQLVMIRPTTGARLSAGYLHDWRLESRTLADMAGWYDLRANLTGDGEPLELKVDRVTVNFFALLGAPPVIGRTFTATSDLGQVEPEAVMSYGLWQRRYGGDPRVIGRRISIDGEPITVVGVMPAGFAIRTTELAESRSDLWLPLRLVPGTRRGMGGTLHVIGRLTPQATRDQAQAELAVIARRLEDANPSYSRDWGVQALPLLDATVMEVRPILLLLFGGVGILLLIACSNVTNLVLARAAGRQTEFAIRLSIGASGARLLRQSLAEGLVLSTIGGLFGVVLAIWGTRALVASLPSGLDMPRTREIGIDGRMLGFAVLVTVATAMVIGLVPAIVSTRSAALAALKDVTRGSSTTRGRARLASGLVVSEVALAIVLLAGAGLLARSFYELTRVQPGFNADGVVTLRTTLGVAKYDADDRIRAFNDELVARTQALPGVRAVGTINYLPLSNSARADRFEIVGRPEARLEDQKFALTAVISGRYFEAMQIPLIRGRVPNANDTAATEPVFVIDEGLAREYWPGRDPIGERLSWSMAPARKTPLTGQIIGVVGSVRWTGLTGKAWSSAYIWFPNLPGREISVVARTTGDPSAVAAPMAAVVSAIDPNQPVSDVRVMGELVSAELARPRFTMLLLGVFAAAALLLAALGLYGVLAFAVVQRTREIGIRVALGAQARDVLHLVIRRGALLIGAGLLIGLASALALGRFVVTLLYGVTPRDLPTLAAVTVFLVVIGSLATYLPARRAVRVDPMDALRAE